MIRQSLAIVVVREGTIPLGGEEAIAEANGSVLLVGSGVEAAANELSTQVSGDLFGWEAGEFRPAAWAKTLIDAVAPFDVVILPASPDGRDFAPHLSAVLRRALIAGATRVSVADGIVRVEAVRQGGLVSELYETAMPVVITMQPGVRGIDAFQEHNQSTPALRTLSLAMSSESTPSSPEFIEMMPPDPATMDLSEASRIVAGGQGLGSEEAFVRLAEIASALGASVGATRVAADAGWVPFERQIGTTGVTVNPRLYLALAISGAVQHTSGLGNPDHIISVNLDSSCPMMTMADLAIVCDARALIDELAVKLLKSNEISSAMSSVEST